MSYITLNTKTTECFFTFNEPKLIIIHLATLKVRLRFGPISIDCYPSPIYVNVCLPSSLSEQNVLNRTDILQMQLCWNTEVSHFLISYEVLLTQLSQFRLIVFETVK